MHGKKTYKSCNVHDRGYRDGLHPMNIGIASFGRSTRVVNGAGRSEDVFEGLGSL